MEQGGGDSSDQSDSVLDSVDEDDEADDFQRLSEVELLRKAIQLCKVLEVKLGTNRPPPFWSEVQQLQFLDKKKLPHNLPQLPIVLRQLVGSQILVYKAEVSSGSLLTMTTQKRLACYFASHGAFTGEHFESLNEKPLMQARLKSGLIISVPASQIVGSITALVGKLETQTVSDNAILFGVSANYMKQYVDTNVKGQSISAWKATAVWNVSPEKAEDEEEKDEKIKALREIDKEGWIDVFEVARNKGKGINPDPEKSGNPEAEPKENMCLSKADKQLLGLHDPRLPLSKATPLQVYVWCCMFSCRGILDRNDRACGKYCSKRESSCVCDGCGTKYDANMQVVCTMCECHLPHSDKYVQQQSNFELHDVLSVGEKKKSRSAVSRSKLKEQIAHSVLLRMLNDSRGRASTASGMVQTTFELVDMIGAMTTSVASNKQAASTPVTLLLNY